MANRPSRFHGLLVVDKPGLPRPAPTPREQRPPTSHDVVQRVRRWSGQRRIGHTGTLDPMASGVLVLCLGAATRLVEYYQGHDKEYSAEVRLGSSTDTYDVLGTVMDTALVPVLDAARIEEALSRFRGRILQTPPAYSALKQDGERSHRRARRGDVVRLTPRPVTIQRLDLVEIIAPDRLQLWIRCSAGTYVRSLAHDLGIALGTVAHLTALRRTAAGAFRLDHAHSLEEIEAAAVGDRLADLLRPLDDGLDLPGLVLSGSEIERLGFGQRVVLSPPARWSQTGATLAPGMLVRGLDPEGRLVGLLRALEPAADQPGSGRLFENGMIWKAEKWFAVQRDERRRVDGDDS